MIVAPPEGLADDRHRSSGGPVQLFVGVEGAAGQSVHAEHIEEVAGDGLSPHPHLCAAFVEVEGLLAEGRHAHEGRSAARDVARVRVGGIEPLAVGRGGLDRDQACRVADARDRRDQNPLHPAEDRGIHRHPEGNRYDRDRRESRPLSQAAAGVTHFTEKTVHTDR